MSSQNNKSISGQRAELSELLAWFESEDFEIEKAIEQFKKAETLAQEIEKELTQHKNSITVLKNKFDQD